MSETSRLRIRYFYSFSRENEGKGTRTRNKRRETFSDARDDLDANMSENPRADGSLQVRRPIGTGSEKWSEEGSDLTCRSSRRKARSEYSGKTTAAPRSLATIR